jgi:hypothetical protein
MFKFPGVCCDVCCWNVLTLVLITDGSHELRVRSYPAKLKDFLDMVTKVRKPDDPIVYLIGV